LRAVIGWLGRVLLVFCVIEGIASVARVALLLAANAERPLAERAHTEYDPELGWINRPNVALVDLYGPGASLHVNAQRFRGVRDVAPRAPEGRIRVVCSGDSFALGYGVGDEEAWCRLFEEIEPRIESINMGQGGYGIDQAYLWFLRDGRPLAPHVHLFTFIVEDFARMGETSFFGYGKPRLRREGDRLHVENVPVPRTAFRLPWLAQNARFADELRSVALLRALVARTGVGARAEPDAGAELPLLAAAVFAELARLHREAGSALVLVYLPMREELRDDSTRALRGFVAETARRLDVPFLDGVEALRALPEGEAETLYIEKAATSFPAAAGHFDARGNRWAAEWLVAALRERGVLDR